MPRPERLGPYRIEKPLGKGGMGHVYLAVHEESGDRVAVKVLSPELAVAEGFRERFEAEIESLRMLRHAGIVALYGYGEDNGALFYSMELVDGASLDEELRAGRRFGWREVADITIQVCRALKHAHDHGVVHRDIKPANILINRQERVKLADFGIARLFGSTQLTTAGGVLGTADFMAPEQADGRPVTDRCDQYSLGCVMYALLAGRPPFRAKSLPEMLQLQRYAEPEPVRRYAPQTPKQLELTIGQMLAKSPAERFPNTLVLARHLEAMIRALSRPAHDDFHIADDGGTSIDLELVAEDPLKITQATPPDGESQRAPAGPSAGPPAGAAMASDALREMPTQLETGARGEATIRPESHNQAPAPPDTRFTVVGAEAGDAPDLHRWTILGQAVLFVALLAATVAGGVYLFRPRTADALFADITLAAESLGEGMSSALRDDVEEFFERFPDDPRTEELGDLRRGTAVSALERRLRAAALRGPRGDRGLTPPEQLYVAALRRARVDPLGAAGQFMALITLLEPPGKAASADDKAIATLAGRQIEKLRDANTEDAQHQRPFVASQLEAARQLRTSAPDRAVAICRAIITLYADRPWAADIVRQAEELQQSLAVVPPPDDPVATVWKESNETP